MFRHKPRRGRKLSEKQRSDILELLDGTPDVPSLSYAEISRAVGVSEETVAKIANSYLFPTVPHAEYSKRLQHMAYEDAVRAERRTLRARPRPKYLDPFLVSIGRPFRWSCTLGEEAGLYVPPEERAVSPY